MQAFSLHFRPVLTLLGKTRDSSISKVVGQKKRKMVKERGVEVMKKEVVGEAGRGGVTVPVFVLFAPRCILAPPPVVLATAGGVSQAPLSANFWLGLT